MDSEKKRSDEYWMGVRDALRMVDSFTKWARRNESRAKNLEDFIHDGLVAAAKRCESCLKDDLGLTFAGDEMPTSESTDIEQVPSGYEIDSSPQDYSKTEEPSEPAIEATPEDKLPETSEVPIESENDAISIDTVGRLEEEEVEDISIDGPPREFSSDFELVEPSDLLVEQPTPKAEVIPESESITEESITTDTEHTPSFTWDDYEKAVTPAKEDSELGDEEEAVEIPPPVEMESVEPLATTEEPEPSSETVSMPEPPAIPTDEFVSDAVDEEATDTTDEPEPITEPPPPPPPPDSDEDEDERRRRARRLFFGD